MSTARVTENVQTGARCGRHWCSTALNRDAFVVVVVEVVVWVGGWRRGGRDVEANDSFQRQFTPSCKVSTVSFEI